MHARDTATNYISINSDADLIALAVFLSDQRQKHTHKQTQLKALLCQQLSSTTTTTTTHI